ncbi:glutamate--cysteine ligase [Clostridium sp. D2Q-11]|uniref:Glutamate--cysteine ligase n=1 Tax=Anaeromonas frigoriresistens TaxID=2683708 RepID=A0A942Z7T2_9FIRM|nr:glutamate-cysteine ligase family protein [Anaeromonas frigoriresistens]MBS4539047.1 glutamate--cysteine ligase [Anaeromonas frigoriresistens]
MKEYSMDRQIQSIVDYFTSNNTEERDFKVGAEFEHFILNKETLETVHYGEKYGVAHTLEKLIDKGWHPEYNHGHILGLSKKDVNITLEPGAQFEVSIDAKENIKDIERIYLDFLKDIIPILEDKNQYLVSMGYHPVSKIDNIPFIPKERYKHMSEYFSDKGVYAHNMMKGTASIQVAIDYSDEEDFKKKFRLANLLSPILSLMFDNSPIFEENIYPNNILRTDIWNKCDDDRSKIVSGALDKEFGFKEYTEYILNTPPILIKKDDEFLFVGDKLVKELFDPEQFTKEELEHIMTMFFPDVRAKGFIEIRMMDAVPYPLNLAGVALIKGIMYSNYNINELLNVFKGWNNNKIDRLKKEIISDGFEANIEELDIKELIDQVIDLAYEKLENEEKSYLEPLKEMVSHKKNPAIIVKKNIHKGLENSLKCCILNNLSLEEN